MSFIPQTLDNLTWIKGDSSGFGWLDLPYDSPQELFLASSGEIKELSRLLELYHEIQKNSVDYLSHRILTLGKIVFHLKQMKSASSEVSYNDLCDRMASLAQSKLNYLSAIEKINSLGTDCLNLLEKYHKNIGIFQSERFKPLAMTNLPTYSVKMKEVWGDFWLETLDPCHRRLSPYYSHWKMNQAQSDLNFGDFFLFLESQYMPKYIPTVPYLSGAKLDPYRVKVENGLLITGNGESFSSNGGRWIFVVDLNFDFYVAHSQSGMWHSSFTCGQAVLGVGVLSATNGLIDMYSIESGHYRPDLKQGYQTLQILQDLGSTFSDPLSVQFYEERTKYKVSVTKADLLNLTSFLRKLNDPSKREVIAINEF